MESRRGVTQLVNVLGGRNLSYQEQQALLSRLIPLVEDSWTYLEEMALKGWNTTRANIDFEELLGDAEDVRLHRHLVVEGLKFKVGTPNIRYHIGGAPYGSAFLRDFLTDHASALIRQYGESPPVWAKEHDPCMRKLERLRLESPDTFALQKQHMEERKNAYRVDEIIAHPSPLVGDFAHLSEIYSSLIASRVQPLGFEYDAARSKDNAPVFSKPLIGAWRLCVSAEPLVWYLPKLEGEARIVLSLQHCPLNKRLRSAGFNRYLIIEYGEFVNFFEFSYRVFRSIDELNVLILARIDLMSLLLDKLEEAICFGLGDLDSG